MKKFLAIISLALIIATLACLLSSCGAAKLKGTWKAEKNGMSETITFKSGGKGSITTTSFYGTEKTTEFTYKVKGKKLTIKQGSTSSTVEYKIKGDTLTISNGSRSIEYKKVK